MLENSFKDIDKNMNCNHEIVTIINTAKWS